MAQQASRVADPDRLPESSGAAGSGNSYMAGKEFPDSDIAIQALFCGMSTRLVAKGSNGLYLSPWEWLGYIFRMKPALNWIHTESGSYLHWNYGCVAYVTNDGRVVIQGWGVRETHPSPSVGQGRKFIERWVERRTGFPGMRRRRKR